MKARLLSILCILLMSLGILAQTKTRSADSWNYTIYEIADGQVVRTTKSTGEPNQEISVPYHRYNLLDGKLYLRGAAGGPKGLEYNHYFWLNEDGQTEYLGYEPTYITDVVYLAEGEDIPGMTLCDNDNMRIRSSNSAAAYAADGPVGFVTLPAGSYQLTAFIHSSHKNPDSYWSFFAGDKEIANLHCTVVNIQELQSEVFTLTEQTTLYIPQYGDERNGIDLLYITKAMPTIVANDLTMTYGGDVPTLTYTVQYTDNALDGAPKLSTTATKTSPVGTYPIKVEKGTVTGDNIIYVDGTLTITKAPLTVSVQDVTITRGDAIPSFSLTYDGWRNDDTEDIALIKKPTTKTVAQSDSPAGVYDIYVEGGEATNYALNYQSGKLTILPVSGDKWNDVGIKRQITHPQPMTGIAQWPYKARKVYATHGQSIQLEFHYFLPCKVVTGCKEDGTILYDWSSFDEELNDVASRGHQLVARFRYEYPESDDVDGKPGTTAVPNYIKQLPDYNETYSETYTTYYADWSNIDLQRFTLQFYTDFCQRYAHDPRLAFLEVGFGHWSEYHINAEPEYGKNFPSLEYQKTFLLNMSKVSDGLPWLVSKNAADNSPIAGDEELMALRFGLFEDSFMGEFFTRGGYEPNWNSMGGKTRWQTGVVGGENGDYDEQYNFLNPEGLFGHTFEEMIPKYHVTFLTIDHITDNPYVTPERLKQASIAMGYRFVVKKCATDGTKTLLLVRNEGIAPIYRDAYFAIGDVRSNTSLKGLLPNEEAWVEVDAKPRSDGKDIKIVSDFILPQQEIEFEADEYEKEDMEEKVVYTIAEGETFASGTTIERPNITLTFGETGGPDFLPADYNPLNHIFQNLLPGNEVNGNMPGGTFYVFSPQKDGILTIAVRQNRIKKLYIEENGTPLPEFNGVTLDESHSLEYMFTLPVKAGASYKLYCEGSKLGFYGFIFLSRVGLMCDVNGDGEVNAADIVCLIKIMMHPSFSDKTFADLNGDGVLDEKDIEVIVKMIM